MRAGKAGRGIPLPPPGFWVGGGGAGSGLPPGLLDGDVIAGFTHLATLSTAIQTTLSVSAPVIIPLQGANVADLELIGSDAYIQFGDENLLEQFDPAWCLYYPTSFFTIEPIGVPDGATQVAVMAVQADDPSTVQLDVTPLPLAAFSGYGGVKQKATWTVDDYTATFALNASITALPVTIIVRGLNSELGSNRMWAALVEGSATDNTAAFNDPRMGFRTTLSDSFGATYNNSTATNTGGMATTNAQDMYFTSVSEFTNSAGLVAVGCWLYYEPLGVATELNVTAAAALAYTGTYTRLCLGGLVNATGNQPLSTGDEVVEVMVYAGVLTKIQKQQFSEVDSPPWDVLVPDPTLIRAWVECVAGVFVERTQGKSATAVISGATTPAFSTYTGFRIRRHNRLVANDASGVVNIPYSNVASAVTALPSMSSCMWRGHAHDTIKYDPVTASSGRTLAAGVGLFYAQGGAIDTTIVNNSGSASDIGILNLQGMGYAIALYDAEESGLAYAVTSGVVNLGGTTIDNINVGTVNRSWAMFKPTTGSGWPCVGLAVGAGGQMGGGGYTEGDNDSEYGDLAASLASRGYCVLMCAFADAGQTAADGQWSKFDYNERIGEFRTLITTSAFTTILGYTPTDVMVIGHSGGALTALPIGGATWWDNNVAHALGVAAPFGGGTVRGCVQMSGQGVQSEQRNAETRTGTWSAVTVPTLWMTGTADSGGIAGGTYLTRVTGYNYITPGLATVKVIGNEWHHLYGGSLSTATTDDKKRAYNQRNLAQNIIVAFCDYCCSRNLAAATSQLTLGWDDAQINTYATKDL